MVSWATLAPVNDLKMDKKLIPYFQILPDFLFFSFVFFFGGFKSVWKTGNRTASKLESQLNMLDVLFLLILVKGSLPL